MSGGHSLLPAHAGEAVHLTLFVPGRPVKSTAEAIPRRAGGYFQLGFLSLVFKKNAPASKLDFQALGAPGTPATFYVRVLDWTGSARPDFFYDLAISGAH